MYYIVDYKRADETRERQYAPSALVHFHLQPLVKVADDNALKQKARIFSHGNEDSIRHALRSY